MESKVEQQRTHFLVHYSIQTLEQYMRSGIGYLLNVVVGSSDRLVRLRYWQDELLLLVDWAVKLFYLSKHTATYAEYFYGFERGQTQPRTNNALKASVLLAFYPYVRNKLEQHYNSLKMEHPVEEMNWQQKTFYYLFPLVVTLWDLFDLALKFLYLLKNDAKHFDLMFFILKAKLAYKQLEGAAAAGNGLLDMLNKPLVLIIFLLYKALAWYYSSRNQQRPGSAAAREVDAPFKRQDLSMKGVCPLCSKSITSPTVLSCSGYVFCYNCITREVKASKKCPLTGLPATENSLHSLYS